MKLRPELIYVGALVIILIFSGSRLLISTKSLPKFQLKLPELVLPDPSKAINQVTSTSKSISVTPTTTPLPTKKPTTKPTDSNKKITPTPTTTRSCYRFQFVDFNADSSNLCYTKEDYDQLVELKNDWDAAYIFHNFHLSGANQYQKLYEETGTKIYLDAKASSQKQAEEQQKLMDDAARAMYQIKQRGF